MGKNRKAPRYQAGHVDLTQGSGPITKMCAMRDGLKVYKVDTTFRIKSPETLDPEEINPNMPWTASPVANVGSGNIVVARVFIQAYDAIQNKRLKSHINKDNALRIMRKCKENLLACEKSANTVNQQVNEIVERIQKKQVKRERNVYNPLPQVDNLEDSVGSFLRNAKQCIQNLANLVNVFYQTEFEGPRFDKVLKWASKGLRHNKPFQEFLSSCNTKLKFIADLRNAQEHPNEEKQLHIDNFKINPEGSFERPNWHITGASETDIALDMQGITMFLVEFSESLFLHCLIDNIETNLPYQVVEIPKNERDHNCPVRYHVEIDPGKFFPK